MVMLWKKSMQFLKSGLVNTIMKIYETIMPKESQRNDFVPNKNTVPIVYINEQK